MADPIVSDGSFSRWYLSARGPEIRDVQIALHPATGKAFLEKKKPIPDPILLNGLIDTGSDICVIRRDLAEKAQLQQVDAVKLSAVHGETQYAPVYYARIILPNGVDFKKRILAADMQGAYRLLLGRDILEQCLFTYDGLAGTFKLEFPKRRRR